MRILSAIGNWRGFETMAGGRLRPLAGLGLTLALGSLAACSHTPESGAAYRGHEYQYELAEKYRLGNGVEKDPSKAAYWYYKAATSPGWSATRGIGHNGARKKLAEMYRNGEGVPKDYQQAVYWYQEVIQKDNSASAMYQIGELYSTGGPNLPKDEVTAVQWYREAAEQEWHWAQFKLGEAYRTGGGVEKNLDEAARFYEMSALQGNHWAQLRLSESFRSGEGKPRDIAAANDLLRKSAAQGNHWAMLGMGDIYRNGDGVDRDLTQAAEWYTRSAQQGNPKAQRHLVEIGQSAADSGPERSDHSPTR
jgi:uncharacterized protein